MGEKLEDWFGTVFLLILNFSTQYRKGEGCVGLKFYVRALPSHKERYPGKNSILYTESYRFAIERKIP